MNEPNPTAWTALHAAARIACGDALDGEAGETLESAVRLAYESRHAEDDLDALAVNTAPVSTFRLWSAFAESSALRIELGEALDGVGGYVDLESAMSAAFESCVRAALARMPDAVAEVRADGVFN